MENWLGNLLDINESNQNTLSQVFIYSKVRASRFLKKNKPQHSGSALNISIPQPHKLLLSHIISLKGILLMMKV